MILYNSFLEYFKTLLEYVTERTFAHHNNFKDVSSAFLGSSKKISSVTGLWGNPLR
jgi:hypothetical protein